MDISQGIGAVFRCKMAFLKSKFKDDHVRVQRHTVPHFKDLEYSPVRMKFNRTFPSIYQELFKVSKHAIYHWKAL